MCINEIEPLRISITTYICVENYVLLNYYIPNSNLFINMDNINTKYYLRKTITF